MYKIIKIDHDFKIDRQKQPDTPKDRIIFSNYLKYAANLAFKEGMDSDKRRLWNNILDKLDDAVESDEDSFAVNSYEYLFMREIYEKAIVPPNETQSFCIVENAVLNAENGEKKGDKKKDKVVE